MSGVRSGWIAEPGEPIPEEWDDEPGARPTMDVIDEAAVDTGLVDHHGRRILRVKRIGFRW